MAMNDSDAAARAQQVAVGPITPYNVTYSTFESEREQEPRNLAKILDMRRPEMRTFDSYTRSMPATLVKYDSPSLLDLLSTASNRAHIRDLLKRISEENVRSISSDQFDLLTTLEAYPFEYFSQDPAGELKLRIDRSAFNVDISRNTAWDHEVGMPGFNPRNGARWHIIDGETVHVFAANRYRSLIGMVNDLSIPQSLKCLLAVEHCRDQAFDLDFVEDENDGYYRKRRDVYDQMQSNDLEGWLDDWHFEDMGR